MKQAMQGVLRKFFEGDRFLATYSEFPLSDSRVQGVFRLHENKDDDTSSFVAKRRLEYDDTPWASEIQAQWEDMIALYKEFRA